MFTDAYWWEAADLNWSAGDAVEVSLTLASGSGAPLPQLPLAPPTAWFRLTPETHNGVDPFTFRLHFSEDITTDPETLRDHSLDVTGGSVITAGKVGDSGRIWEITVAPASTGDVTMALPAGIACDVTGAICTADGRKLHNRPEITVPGPDAGNDESLTGGDAPVWSATMTVEWVHWGYGYYSTDARKAGSLSPASFEVDGTTYTVSMIETRGWMYIGIDRELPFGFVLELDGTRFASDDASFQAYSYGNVYQWRGANLGWNDGDTVAVRLLPTAPDGRAVGAPTISGTAQVGETLTANTSGIADEDGLENVTFTYQWLADDAEIAGATGSTYTLADADAGKAIKVQVSFTDDAGNDETLTSAASGTVAAQPNSSATDAPAISSPSAPPVVNGPNNVNYVENGTSLVARYGADDPEKDAITWAVAGRDGSAFSIDDGVLEFRTPPNYERPADNDGDNEYQVDVVAADSSEASTTIAVTIKVTDVQDPNIVLIMADDVGYEAFGSYGSTQYRTPRLDELASAGVRFTHAYSKPVCTPSRVALMTGKSNVQNYADFGVLLPGQYTFADLFREAGYTTAIAGKWQLHGGKYSRLTGVEADEAGFDTYCLWNTDKTGESRYWNPSIECDGQVIERGQDDYGPDVFTDFLLAFIESNQDGPFFAYYPMVLPHSPFVPPPDAQCPATDDEQCNFEDMVSRLDHNVGRIHHKHL